MTVQLCVCVCVFQLSHTVIGTIKVIKRKMTKVDDCYLPLLYLGGYYLSSLLYDINQQIALLQQLVFLSRCIYLDRSTDKRQSVMYVRVYGSFAFTKHLLLWLRAYLRRHNYLLLKGNSLSFFFQIQNTFVITTVAINMRHPVLMIILETHQHASKEDCKQTFKNVILSKITLKRDGKSHNLFHCNYFVNVCNESATYFK